MDLRIQRTKSSIKSAFLELRQKKPIEKITVTEMTKLANINKATFYLHYSDIYQLSEEIEDSILSEILMELDVVDKFFENPQEYANKIFSAFVAHRAQLDLVFSGSRRSLLSDKLEMRIKESLFANFPDFYSRENSVILSFCIQGIFHTIKTGAQLGDMQEDYDVLSHLTSMVISEIKKPETTTEE